MRRVLAFSQRPNTVRPVHENKPDSLVESPCTGVKVAISYQTTASAAAQSKAQLKGFQQGWYGRLRSDPKTSWSLSNDALRNKNRSEVEVQTAFGASEAFPCRRRRSKIAGYLTFFLVPRRIRVGGRPAGRGASLVLQSRSFFGAIVYRSDESTSMQMCSRKFFQKARKKPTTLEERPCTKFKSVLRFRVVLAQGK